MTGDFWICQHDPVARPPMLPTARRPARSPASGPAGRLMRNGLTIFDQTGARQVPGHLSPADVSTLR